MTVGAAQPVQKPDPLLLYSGAKNVDVDRVHDMLSNTYWGHRRDTDTLKVAIDNSICYSVYRGDKQVGFGRAMTDYATAAYITDVVVDESERGQGLGKLLVDTIVADPRLSKCYMMLSTTDSAGLYSKVGFKPDDTFYSRTEHLPKAPDQSQD